MEWRRWVRLRRIMRCPIVHGWWEEFGGLAGTGLYFQLVAVRKIVENSVTVRLRSTFGPDQARRECPRSGRHFAVVNINWQLANSSSARAIPVVFLLGRLYSAGSTRQTLGRTASRPRGAGRVRSEFWLDPVRFESSRGFARAELRRIEAIIEESESLLMVVWHEHFGN